MNEKFPLTKVPSSKNLKETLEKIFFILKSRKRKK
jgi:hypothetical protein